MEENKIAREILITIIYAGVLGAVIYEPFNKLIDAIINWNWDPLLENTANILTKAALLITTILFFCIDFVYSLLSKRFRKSLIIVDSLIILDLGIICKAIDFEALDIKIMWVVGGYAGFMAVLWVWSKLNLWNNNLGSDDRVHYQNVIKKEGKFFILFLIPGSLAYFFSSLWIWWVWLTIALVFWCSWQYIIVIKERFKKNF